MPEFLLVEKKQFGTAEAVDISSTNHQFSGGRPKALYVGGTQNASVKCRMAGNGQDILFTGVPPGTILPIWCDIVYFDETTAEDMVGLD